MENRKIDVNRFKDLFAAGAEIYMNLSEFSFRYSLHWHSSNIDREPFFKDHNYIVLPSIISEYKEIKRSFVKDNSTQEQYDLFLETSKDDFYEEFDEFLRQNDLENKWFEYEDNKKIEYAVEFCKENNLDYYFGTVEKYEKS